MNTYLFLEWWYTRSETADLKVMAVMEEQLKNLSYKSTVQSRFSDTKFSDNLWFSDYFAKTIFQFNT